MTMEAISDFEDMLALLAKHNVRYLIIGGFAFIYHARPRYTRDLDVWVDPAPDNVERANAALSDFGSPYFLDATRPGEIVQLGVEPRRIDFLLSIEGARFATAWAKRIEDFYGRAKANWIDLDTLIRIKSRIDNPRHQDDARILREVKKRRARAARSKGN